MEVFPRVGSTVPPDRPTTARIRVESIFTAKNAFQFALFSVVVIVAVFAIPKTTGLCIAAVAFGSS
jgi:hypothetical protein